MFQLLHFGIIMVQFTNVIEWFKHLDEESKRGLELALISDIKNISEGSEPLLDNPENMTDREKAVNISRSLLKKNIHPSGLPLLPYPKSDILNLISYGLHSQSWDESTLIHTGPQPPRPSFGQFTSELIRKYRKWSNTRPRRLRTKVLSS